MNAPASPHYRLVDKYLVQQGCEPLAQRVATLIPENTDYVVFDLDRTVHLGITIGEKLGWEILVDPFLPPDEPFEEAASRLKPVVSARKPLHTLATLGRGLNHWGLPGLIYASTVRLGDRWPGWGRFLSVTVDPAYVDRVQALMRSVLMATTADYSREEVRVYAERAWRRWQSQLVVDAEVTRAIRARCPNLKGIFLSSASTAPTVEHAAEKLGADGFVSSAVDVYEVEDRSIYSAPAGIPGWFRRRRPRFFSRPGALVHNSAESKVSLLRMQYPEVFAADTVSVGISDNNYGEDRSWPNHFDHAIALNSQHPFSPMVAPDSPCQSVQLVDARPIAAPEDAPANPWLGTLGPSETDAGTLFGRFAEAELSKLDALTDQLRAAREKAATAVDASVRQGVANVGARLTDAVERYNESSAGQKSKIAREMNKLSAELRQKRSAISKAGRDCARIQHEIEVLHRSVAQALAARQV